MSKATLSVKDWLTLDQELIIKLSKWKKGINNSKNSSKILFTKLYHIKDITNMEEKVMIDGLMMNLEEPDKNSESKSKECISKGKLSICEW